MSNRTLSLDDRLYEYMLDVAVNESELLQQLRIETIDIEFSAMQISPEQGQFMTLLMRLIGARHAIELGTYTGYSSICIANGLLDDGELICCDISDDWTKVARKYWVRAGLDKIITLHIQPAAQTLQALLDEGRASTFDFVFIDADKQNYISYYELALKLLRTGWSCGPMGAPVYKDDVALQDVCANSCNCAMASSTCCAGESYSPAKLLPMPM